MCLREPVRVWVVGCSVLWNGARADAFLALCKMTK